MNLFYNNTVLVVDRQVPSLHHFRHMKENTVGLLSQPMTKILESHKKDSQTCEGWNRAAHTMSEKTAFYVLWWSEWGWSRNPFQSSFTWPQDPACCWPGLLSLAPLGSHPPPRRWQILLVVSLGSRSHQPSLTLHGLDLAPTLMRVTYDFISVDLSDLLGHNHSPLISAVARECQEMSNKGNFSLTHKFYWEVEWRPITWPLHPSHNLGSLVVQCAYRWAYFLGGRPFARQR